MEIFVDSDVIISSLLSKVGAAYALLYTDTVIPVISSISQKELEVVVNKLNISQDSFEELLKEKCKIVPLLLSNDTVKKTFKEFVLDSNDAHIVAGANEAQVRCLITYNLKDF